MSFNSLPPFIHQSRPAINEGSTSPTRSRADEEETAAETKKAVAALIFIRAATETTRILFLYCPPSSSARRVFSNSLSAHKLSATTHIPRSPSKSNLLEMILISPLFQPVTFLIHATPTLTLVNRTARIPWFDNQRTKTPLLEPRLFASCSTQLKRALTGGVDCLLSYSWKWTFFARIIPS